MKKTIALCACAVIGTTGLSAHAEEGEDPPVIDRHPDIVRFRATPVISGRSDASEDSIVSLQKRFRGDDSWTPVAEKTVGPTPKVNFRLGERKYTADYRYVVNGVASKPVRIRVKPRVRINTRPSDVLVNGRVVISGRFRPLVAGRRADVKWKVNGNWQRLARVKVGDGRFRLRTDADNYGRRRVKVVFSGDRLNAYGKDKVILRIHRRSMATWYGPGFFGNRTACGQRYHRDLLGVAHRHLKCGTKVSVLYKGRSVKVPVVDRGPYSRADWDLTKKTADRLGFSGREEIGVLH